MKLSDELVTIDPSWIQSGSDVFGGWSWNQGTKKLLLMDSWGRKERSNDKRGVHNTCGERGRRSVCIKEIKKTALITGLTRCACIWGDEGENEILYVRMIMMLIINEEKNDFLRRRTMCNGMLTVTAFHVCDR